MLRIVLLVVCGILGLGGCAATHDRFLQTTRLTPLVSDEDTTVSSLTCGPFSMEYVRGQDSEGPVFKLNGKPFASAKAPLAGRNTAREEYWVIQLSGSPEPAIFHQADGKIARDAQDALVAELDRRMGGTENRKIAFQHCTQSTPLLHLVHGTTAIVGGSHDPPIFFFQESKSPHGSAVRGFVSFRFPPSTAGRSHPPSSWSPGNSESGMRAGRMRRARSRPPSRTRRRSRALRQNNYCRPRNSPSG